MANYFDPKAYAKLPGRSKHDLSYRNSFTAKMGQLIPVVCEPVIPGDRFRVGLTYQMQLAPMLNPVYDGLEVNFEAFFVPNRILDPKWREFWTGYNEYDQMTPVTIAPLTFHLETDSSNLSQSSPQTAKKSRNPIIGISSLLDYLGVQFDKYYANGLPMFDRNNLWGTVLSGINAYPVLAYNRIWDDWYRNERTQKASLYNYYNTNNNSRVVGATYVYREDFGAGYPGDFGLIDGNCPCQLHYRNYKKDRFTTALPEPIIGGDIRIPVSDHEFVTPTGDPGDNAVLEYYSSGDTLNLNALALGTIQQLKLALKEYQYEMKDTYNGNRYVESLYSHYGIVVPDSTLQRSIYLGSARDYVNFGEVYQTSSGDGEGTNGALGDYAGRGAANGTHYMFDESFFEPGHFFVLMSISPRSRYFQGIKRMFTRIERDDYFSPEYQNIGDDFIETREIFNSLDFEPYSPDLDNPIFGYNSRWIEYKQRYDELHGAFADPDSPMFKWNFSRAFDNAPLLSSEFSQIQPLNDPFVDMSEREDNYFVDVAIKMDALRPILAVESF